MYFSLLTNQYFAKVSENLSFKLSIINRLFCATFIIPVESQACGTPVIAFGKGGALETIIEDETGLFFYEQNHQSIINAIKNFESKVELFTPEACRKNAENFSKEIFQKKFYNFVEEEKKRFFKN